MATLRIIYTLYLRLTGAALLLTVALLAAARTGHVDIGTAPAAPLWALAMAVGLGLLLAIPWWQPYGLWKPGRRTDAVWVLPHSAVAALLPFLSAPLLGLPAVPPMVAALAPGAIWAAIVPALLVSALIVPRIRGGGKRADRVGRRERRDAAQVAARAQTARIRHAVVAEPKLPTIGAAMKLYVAADWLILRLMGLGLIGVGLDAACPARRGPAGRGAVPDARVRSADGRLDAWRRSVSRWRCRSCSRGAIARPRHVAGGVVKAAGLVVGAIVLLEPLPHGHHGVHAGHLPPDADGHGALPLPAVAGIAVTSVLLVVLLPPARHAAHLDDRSRNAPTMSVDDLRELRTARMG